MLGIDEEVSGKQSGWQCVSSWAQWMAYSRGDMAALACVTFVCCVLPR